MNGRTWKQRLRIQLPGWAVWTTGSQLGVQWHAAPAAPTAEAPDYFTLPNRITAATPQELRTLAQERYGWNDYCGSCGVLARVCGHRRPESRQADTATRFEADCGESVNHPDLHTAMTA